YCLYFFFQAEDGIRDFHVTGVQTCALPIYRTSGLRRRGGAGRGRASGALLSRRGDLAVDFPGGAVPGRPGGRERAAGGTRGGAEIGRASCRERVQLSQVAGAL